MNSLDDTVSIEGENGSHILLTLSGSQGEEDISGISYPIKALRDSITGVSKSILSDVASVGADEFQIEFGIDFCLESGQLTSLIAKGKGAATINVTLTWKK